MMMDSWVMTAVLVSSQRLTTEPLLTNSLLVCTHTECPAGTFGAGCQSNCTCVAEHESSPCDHVDGTCHCRPGYNGSSCEQGIRDCKI